MTDPTQSPLATILLIQLSRVFLPAAGNDADLASRAAEEALGPVPSGGPGNPILDAQIAGFGMAALTALADAQTADDPEVAERLRETAGALGRAAERMRTERQKTAKPAEAPAPETPDGSFNLLSGPPPRLPPLGAIPPEPGLTEDTQRDANRGYADAFDAIAEDCRLEAETLTGASLEKARHWMRALHGVAWQLRASAETGSPPTPPATDPRPSTGW